MRDKRKSRNEYEMPLKTYLLFYNKSFVKIVREHFVFNLRIVFSPSPEINRKCVKITVCVRIIARTSARRAIKIM